MGNCWPGRNRAGYETPPLTNGQLLDRIRNIERYEKEFRLSPPPGSVEVPSVSVEAGSDSVAHPTEVFNTDDIAVAESTGAKPRKPLPSARNGDIPHVASREDLPRTRSTKGRKPPNIGRGQSAAGAPTMTDVISNAAPHPKSSMAYSCFKEGSLKDTSRQSYEAKAKAKRTQSTQEVSSLDLENMMEITWIGIYSRYRERDPVTGRDFIGEEGINQFCRDLDMLPGALEILVFAWMCKLPQQDRIERPNFLQGMKELEIESMRDLQIKLPGTTSDVCKDSGEFKSLYDFTFDFVRLESEKMLPIETAIHYWELLYSQWPNQGPELLHRWIRFLRKYEKQIICIGYDTWNMFPNLVDAIGNDFSRYDAGDAWPNVFDDFYEEEYGNDQTLGAEAPNMSSEPSTSDIPAKPKSKLGEEETAMIKELAASLKKDLQLKEKSSEAPPAESSKLKAPDKDESATVEPEPSKPAEESEPSKPAEEPEPSKPAEEPEPSKPAEKPEPSKPAIESEPSKNGS